MKGKTVVFVMLGIAAAAIVISLLYPLIKKQTPLSPAEAAQATAQQELRKELASLRSGDIVVTHEENTKICVVRYATMENVRMVCYLGSPTYDNYFLYLSKGPIEIVRKDDPSYPFLAARFLSQ